MKIAIIGGTGLSYISELTVQQRKSHSTPYGEPSSDLICGTLNGSKIIFLARHGSEHCIPPHCINYRANLFALKTEGVTSVIAVNAVGGIGADMQAGILVVPDQIIDYSFGREHTYFDGTFSSDGCVSLQHVDFTCPYTDSLRHTLLDALVEQGELVIDGGVHGVTQGPRLESAAEIDRLERDGCDIVGMTGMPEAALARELGMEYVCLALVVNAAAGRSTDVITIEGIQRVLDSGIPKVKKVIEAVCANQ